MTEQFEIVYANADGTTDGEQNFAYAHDAARWARRCAKGRAWRVHGMATGRLVHHSGEPSPDHLRSASNTPEEPTP